MRSTLAALSLLLLGCSSPSNRGEIVLGAAGAWSQAYGTMARYGIELALEELNSDKGLPTVRVVYQDDEGNGRKATEVAQWFVDSGRVVGVIGHLTSGAMKSAAKVYDGNIPAVATAASSPELTGISSWAFRVIASDSVSGIDIAGQANAMQKKRVAILYENNAYGRGLADSFRRNFTGSVIAIDPITESADQDFEPFLAWFRARQPDLIFVAGTDKSGIAFVRAVRQAKLDVTLMGGVGWRGLTSDTANAEGVWVGVPFSAEDDRAASKAFTAAFRAKYKLSPDAGAALAYDATRVLATAARMVGNDPRRVRDWLAATGDGAGFSGATGMVRFGANGDPIDKTNVLARIQHGALVVQR